MEFWFSLMGGINCDAKILDTILRKEMIISVKKKKESDINYL